MSAVNSTSTTGATDLAQLLFKKADRNGDHQVSSDEFKSFLTSLLNGLNTAGSAAPPASTPAVKSAQGAAPGGSTDGLPFASIMGFSLEKLQDPTHVNEKYSASVRLFSQALAATGAEPNSAGLQQLVDWMNAHGATASASNDMITINGDAPVDCITDFGGTNSNWWFHNLP